MFFVLFLTLEDLFAKLLLNWDLLWHLLSCLHCTFVLIYYLIAAREDFSMPSWVFLLITPTALQQWSLLQNYGIPMVGFSYFYHMLFFISYVWYFSLVIRVLIMFIIHLKFILMGVFAFPFFILLVTIQMVMSLQVSVGHLCIRYGFTNNTVFNCWILSFTRPAAIVGFSSSLIVWLPCVSIVHSWIKMVEDHI